MTAVAPIQDDLFTADVIADPYAYYGRLREQDPVHWNEKYDLWVVTRYDDLVWLTRHHELFSSAVFKNDPRPAYPAIDESDLGLYEYVKNYQGDQFIQHDRPEHLEMRRVMHGYFTPKSMEAWRPFVQAAVKELLDAAEEKGSMDVMRDLATPLPVLVIAEMMGVPREDRPYIRQLAEKLLYIGRGEYRPDEAAYRRHAGDDRICISAGRQAHRRSGDDFISVLARGEKQGVFTRHEVLVNTSLLLLAGHETTAAASGATTPTTTSGSDLSAVATRVADDLRARFAAVAGSESIAVLQRRLASPETALRQDAADVKIGPVPSSVRAQQTTLAAQLDDLGARLAQARRRAEAGDLTGALSVLRASGYQAVEERRRRCGRRRLTTEAPSTQREPPTTEEGQACQHGWRAVGRMRE